MKYSESSILLLEDGSNMQQYWSCFLVIFGRHELTQGINELTQGINESVNKGLYH